MLALCSGRPLDAQAVVGGTTNTFRQFAGQVFKVQVVETGSAAKAGIGSGFLVSADGRMITNFHVISNVVNTPARYRAELIDSAGKSTPVKVLAVDIVHDLAVLQTELRNRPFFRIEAVAVSQGDRLFSLGNPEDLGLSIVEGTYNGLLSHTLYPRIHLTASINPGMSGGPTIDGQGHVIGVNVATGGDQLGFLVPVDQVSKILGAAPSGKTLPIAPSPAELGKQLERYQDNYLKGMFDASTRTIEFGPYRVPTQPAPFFRCWGDRFNPRERTYGGSYHQCETDEYIYLGDDQITGTLQLRHELLTSRELNAPRFFKLYNDLYKRDNSPVGEVEFVTNWKCQTRNVRNNGLTMQVAQCLRRYKTIGALYDSYVKVAALGRSNVGLISTMTVTGVTFEHATKVTERYLSLISWR
ncbi:MAG: trypsin-like peptidase domain-containing protein [Phycisphaerae bacterium]|nr:trypsin-like peptidase domain-containing protein [Gemmatimonadaceae bacterium]